MDFEFSKYFNNWAWKKKYIDLQDILTRVVRGSDYLSRFEDSFKIWEGSSKNIIPEK